jgi:hypothetical protein
MKDEMPSIYHNKQLDEFYYPALKQYESEIDMLTMDEPVILNDGSGPSVQETGEYGLWMAKNPAVLPDYWR